MIVVVSGYKAKLRVAFAVVAVTLEFSFHRESRVRSPFRCTCRCILERSGSGISIKSYTGHTIRGYGMMLFGLDAEVSN